MKRSALLLVALLATLILTAFPGFAQTPPAGLPEMQTAAPSGTIVVKLTTGSDLAMAPEGLVARPGALSRAAAKAAGLQDLAAQLVPGARLTQRIPTARVLPADKARQHGQPDLALYADLATEGLDRQELIRIVARLNAHPDVELAFLEPRAVPAALGFDAFTGRYTPPAVPNPAKRTAENFQDLQGYLEQAPLGVGALAMRDIPGQRGDGVTVIDVEGGWLWTHEDLPTPVVELGVQIDDLSWRNHGTAVMGEIRGIDNGTGVTGIVPDCQVGSSSIGNVSTAAALHAAIEVLQPGDVILIELHAPGPLSDGSGQFGYLPMEYWQDNFDAIRLATSRGILVCEAAGNGNQNLDDPVYMNLFDRQVRDSGAIMCGATAGSELIAAGFSNHGQRVDLNGWGWDVTTTGYGDLYGAEESEYYTFSFSGTSSASPIVTGSVASLQAMVRQELGLDLDARLARDLLRTTGTPMGAGNPIGTRPNLEAAFALASTTVGELQGTVTDQTTGTPLAGVMIQVEGQGSFTSTADDGTWRLPLQAGPVDLTFTSFLYQDTTINTATTAGVVSVVDQALTMRPLIDLRGTVFGPDQTPLGDVRVTPLDHPVNGGTSGPDGSFAVTDVPAGYTYRLRFDGLPGYGAQVVILETSLTSGDAL
nr:carboxypeptidase regulatory-like domain-containing protein [Candidatus Krumholzibacteria bacterium]